LDASTSWIERRWDIGELRAADLAVFPFVWQFRVVNADWFNAHALPATQPWLHGWLQSELFAACMKKSP
jgi:glutathione S-transferase